METCGSPLSYSPAIHFKSHHSGMETYSVVNFATPGSPLNRTIVGWKPSGCRAGWLKRCGFKSHHSGMETIGNDPGDTMVGDALNRTIVGWKRSLTGNLQRAFTSLNRTIVGWKLQPAARAVWSCSTLNRTIVGWKPEAIWPEFVSAMRL